MDSRWQLRVSNTVVNSNLPRLLNAVLSRRDFSPDLVAEFLYPDYGRDVHDPYKFRDMSRVVERIMQAIATAEHIVIFGDYDADGVCAAAVLASTLQALGATNVRVQLPDRTLDGYGLNLNVVEKAVTLKEQLLITVDCGITNVPEVAAAQASGIDTIIIDHHLPPTELPTAFAIINPKVEGETYPFLDLAAVALAFKVSQALLRQRVAEHDDEKNQWEAFEKWLLDFVAIATVTDLVPLSGENRALLHFGLRVLNKTRRPGLIALFSAIGLTPGSITAHDIAYRIGPRINAAGRVGSAHRAYELLMATDAAEAKLLADKLETSNAERRQLTETVSEEASALLVEQKDEPVLVAFGEDWPVGLVGLVASRMLERHARPVLIMTRTAQGIVGSGRSIPGFNIVEALRTVPHLFSKFGGHAQACGFTLQSAEAVDELRNALRDVWESTGTSGDSNTLLIDETIELRDCSRELVDGLRLLEPCGMANPTPLFLVSNVIAVGVVAFGDSSQHLRLTLTDGVGTVRHGVGFGLGAWHEQLRLGDRLDVVAEVAEHTYRDVSDIQLRIVGLRSAL